MKSVELSLNTLRVLLFGDDRLEGIKPRSKGIGDTAKVIVLPYAIGTTLQQLDKDEELFHVEFSRALEGVADFAEIWLSFEWKESNARRERVQKHSAESRAFRDKNAARLAEIKEALPVEFSKYPGYTDHLAAQMLKAYKEGHIKQVLTIFNLAEKFARYEQEDKEQQ